LKLFAPPLLSCPLCHPDPQWPVYYETTAFSYTGNRAYEGTRRSHCSHEFSLYSALRVMTRGGQLGIVNAFSHKQWQSAVPIVPGQSIDIRIPVVDGLKPFVAFGAANGGEAFSAEIIIIADNRAVALTSAAAGERVSDEAPRLALTVHYRDSSEETAWSALLYESLADYAHKRHWRAIVKLAASIEIFADRLYDKYLRDKGRVVPDVAARILEDGSSWEMRFRRIEDIAALLLPLEAQARYVAAAPLFRQSVRKPRLDCVRGTAEGWAYDEASRAFEAAFDVLWTFDELNQLV
jgi:hypothetical protein